MNAQTCRMLPAYLSDLQAGNLAPPLAVVEHIEQCTACRVMVFGVFHALDLQPIDDLDCALCQAQLDGFVEVEESDPQAARIQYPGVWKHLWSCSACLESYQMLVDLLAAPLERSLDLPQSKVVSINMIDQIFRQPQQLNIWHATLQAALPATLSVARRSLYAETADTYEILEGLLESTRYLISARPYSNEIWEFVLCFNPPPLGLVQLTIKDYTVLASMIEPNTFVAAIPVSYLYDSTPSNLSIQFYP